MYGENERVYYYLTTMNENYPHPAMPAGQKGFSVFFRPQQSEAVFLQFGDIVVVDVQAGKIVQRWPVFAASA